MKTLILVLIIAFLMTGCTKEQALPENNTQTTVDTDRSFGAFGQTEETRVLAASGMADDMGFYSIDLPRNVNDLVYLDSINSRLAWVSVVMVKENIMEFEKAKGNLLWHTLSLEAAFNYGSTPPFVEGSDGKYTTISKADFNNFAKSCFAVDDEDTLNNLHDGFTADNDTVRIDYMEPDTMVFGFVITDYKQEGLHWYIKGELMKENSVFAKGVFTLEKNDDKEIVPFKIVSFEETK